MKKTNIKRFFVLFCVLACVFSMTACTNTISSDSAKTSLKDMKVNQYASDMVQWAEDMLVYLDQTSDAQIKADGEAAKTLSYVNGKVYVVNMQGMNDKTIEFYNSWVKTREDLGTLTKKKSESVMKQEHCARLQSMQHMKQEPAHLSWSLMMISTWTAVQLTRLIQQVRRWKRLY